MRNTQTRDYLREVGGGLTGLSRADRAVLLDELDAALAGMTHREEIVAAFGEPQAYAATVMGIFADEGIAGHPQRRVLGIPVEFRGLWNRQVRSRIWDPGNPQLLVPRLFGAGWSLNMGSLAVHLGLIRADDCDDEVLDAIPESVTGAARALPVVLTAAQLLALAACWHRLPQRVATGFGATGRVRSTGPRWVLWLAPLGATAATCWSFGADPDDGTDRLLRPAIAAWLATLCAGTTLASLLEGVGRQERGSRAGLAVPAGVLAAGTLLLGGLALPVRAGLRASWRHARSDGSR